MSDIPLHSVVFERPIDIPGRRSTQACVGCHEPNRPQWSVAFCPELGCVRITYTPIDGSQALVALIPLDRVCAMNLPPALPLSDAARVAAAPPLVWERKVTILERDLERDTGKKPRGRK